MTETIQAVLAKMRTGNGAPKYVEDWKAKIPAWSRWQPGYPGDPNCERCEGTGYITLDVRVGHPYFGKILFCECVPAAKVAQHEAYLDSKK